MRKALRTLVALTTLLALPMGAAAQVTTFDYKLITICQKNTSTTYYLSSENGSDSKAAWTTDKTAANIFFLDASNHKLVSVTTGKVLKLDNTTESRAFTKWDGVADAQVYIYASQNTNWSDCYNVRFANGSSSGSYRILFNYNSTSSNAGALTLDGLAALESPGTYGNNCGYFLTVEEATAPTETFTNALATYFSTLSTIDIGTNYGQYSGDGYNEALASCQALKTDATFDEIKTALEAYNVADNVKCNVPQAGDFLRVRSKATGDYYLAAGTVTYNGSNRASFETGKATSGETIFYFDGKHLINYSNGFYLADINSKFLGYNGEVTEGSIVSFLPSVFTSRAGQFHVMFNDGARSLYCRTTEGCTDAAGMPDASNSDYNVDGYHFILEKVTELPLTVSEAGYATFKAPVALQIPDEVEAYMVDEEPADGKIKVKKVTETTNNGLIVKANPGTYNFPIDYGYEDPTGADISDYLRGDYITQTISQDDNVYIFGKKDSKIGFFKMSSGDRQIHAYRAYYCPEESSGEEGAAGISAFIIDEGSITGISDTIATDATDTTDACTYDLQGRRVSAPTKGLYIKGGKKIYVK